MKRHIILNKYNILKHFHLNFSDLEFFIQNRRGRFPNNERMCAARFPYVVPATRCSLRVFILSPSVFVLSPRFAEYRSLSYPPTKKRCPPTNDNCGEGERGGGYGAKSPKNEQIGNYGGKRGSFEKKRESRSDEAAVFILPGPIQISTRPPAPPSPNHPPSMHPVNYDEPDHDQMVAEDQRDTTSTGGSATKRHHAENNQDDDGKF